MHPRSDRTLGRVARLVTEFLAPAVVRERAPLETASRTVAGEPVPFATATAQTFTAHPVGTRWGRAWDTVWFHLTGEVPPSWPAPGTRCEIAVDLGFNQQMPGFQSEGLVWTPSGTPLRGISPKNAYVPVAAGTSSIDLYLEAAANPDVYEDSYTTPTARGLWETAGEELLYELRRCELVLVDEEVERLKAEATVLRDLALVLEASSPRRAEILFALDRMCDAVSVWDVAGTAPAGRRAIAGVLAAGAAASAHTIYAVGHAHIDSAWLWPIRETSRKVGRTVSNVLALMEEEPEFSYAFSSAQQYVWLQEAYPELFERLRDRVAEGRVLPMGGMWVESDTNLVGGEALVRQFVHGQKYFLATFGEICSTAWLPDSFGYSAQLPQIARLAGCEDLFAQKMCWNDTNSMPHHTFWWEGLDGSRLFTHFTPIDTYNARLKADQLSKASRQFAEKGPTNVSLAAFGFGDGGGGPTREMVRRVELQADLDGSPRVRLATPAEFFARARTEYAELAPTWVGEMYLEFHRGTYTSQARTKRGNRRTENLLREAELWATTAAVLRGVDYPYAELEEAWRTALLLQFHDILPGSSIAWVHRDAEARYAELDTRLSGLIERSLDALTPVLDGDVPGLLAANPSPFPQRGVAPFAIGRPARPERARGRQTPAGIVLANDVLSVTVSADGSLASVERTDLGRQCLAPGRPTPLLELFEDVPNDFEAWDLDEHYAASGRHLPASDVELVTTEDGAAAVRLHIPFGASVATLVLTLADGADPTLHLDTDVDWHERRRLLKLGVAVAVNAMESVAETQFGHVRRPTHTNTSWDVAKFETPTHRWVYVGEPGFGVAMANDATYGYDASRIPGVRGGAVRLRASLLRAPMFPDPQSDQGRHGFAHAIRFGTTLEGAAQLGAELNLPLRDVDAAGALAPLVALEGDGVSVEAVKLAEDRGGDVVVRVFETQGSRRTARLRASFPVRRWARVDLLEREESVLAEGAGPVDAVELALRPFEIVTVRLTPER